MPGPLGPRQLGGEHLQRDDAVHRAVLGLEHPAHAAAADLVEDAILTQHEPRHPAGQQVLRLEAGEQSLLDQKPGDDAATIGGR